MRNIEIGPPRIQPSDGQRDADDWGALLRFLVWLIGGGLVLVVAGWLVGMLADKNYRDAIQFAWAR